MANSPFVKAIFSVNESWTFARCMTIRQLHSVPNFRMIYQLKQTTFVIEIQANVCLTNCGSVTPYMASLSKASLLQVMPCCLTAPNHHLKQCWLLADWTLRNKLWPNLIQNTKIFFYENAFENVVCKMVAILFRLYHVRLDFRPNYFIVTIPKY